MYSPHSDLYKMFHTPGSILFKVRVGEKEYYGRVDTIGTQKPYKGEPVRGKFLVYDDLKGFEAGTALELIPVDSSTIEGLEAIDTLNPAPLNAILAACNEINEITTIYPVADIGLIRHELPVYLEDLLAAMLEFEQLHELKHGEKEFTDIEIIKENLVRIADNAPESERKNALTDCREVVSTTISAFIELAAYATYKKEPS